MASSESEIEIDISEKKQRNGWFEYEVLELNQYIKHDHNLDGEAKDEWNLYDNDKTLDFLEYGPKSFVSHIKLKYPYLYAKYIEVEFKFGLKLNLLSIDADGKYVINKEKVIKIRKSIIYNIFVERFIRIYNEKYGGNLFAPATETTIGPENEAERSIIYDHNPIVATTPATETTENELEMEEAERSIMADIEKIGQRVDSIITTNAPLAYQFGLVDKSTQVPEFIPKTAIRIMGSFSGECGGNFPVPPDVFDVAEKKEKKDERPGGGKVGSENLNEDLQSTVQTNDYKGSGRSYRFGRAVDAIKYIAPDIKGIAYAVVGGYSVKKMTDPTPPGGNAMTTFRDMTYNVAIIAVVAGLIYVIAKFK